MAGRYAAGMSARSGWLPLGGLVLGGVVVIVSFTLNAAVVLQPATPTDFAWPIFALGMAIGVVSAVAILRTATDRGTAT